MTNVTRQQSKLRLIALSVMLIGFSAFSLWAMLDVGYFGIWAAGFESSGSLQILIDLVIGCAIIATWMISDARARGVNPAPWILAVMTTGTIAILVYLLVRELSFSKQDLAENRAAHAS